MVPPSLQAEDLPSLLQEESLAEDTPQWAETLAQDISKEADCLSPSPQEDWDSEGICKETERDIAPLLTVGSEIIKELSQLPTEENMREDIKSHISSLEQKLVGLHIDKKKVKILLLEEQLKAEKIHRWVIIGYGVTSVALILAGAYTIYRFNKSLKQAKAMVSAIDYAGLQKATTDLVERLKTSFSEFKYIATGKFIWEPCSALWTSFLNSPQLMRDSWSGFYKVCKFIKEPREGMSVLIGFWMPGV